EVVAARHANHLQCLERIDHPIGADRNPSAAQHSREMHDVLGESPGARSRCGHGLRNKAAPLLHAMLSATSGGNCDSQARYDCMICGTDGQRCGTQVSEPSRKRFGYFMNSARQAGVSPPSSCMMPSRYDSSPYSFG